jgi:hypothetical protein
VTSALKPSIFPVFLTSGLLDGQLPPPLDTPDKLLKLWMQKICTTPNAECQHLANVGDLEQMHEFALRFMPHTFSPFPGNTARYQEKGTSI